MGLAEEFYDSAAYTSSTSDLYPIFLSLNEFRRRNEGFKNMSTAAPPTGQTLIAMFLINYTNEKFSKSYTTKEIKANKKNIF